MSRRIAKTTRRRFLQALSKVGWQPSGQSRRQGKTVLEMKRERGEPPFQKIEIIRGSDGRDRLRYYEKANWHDPWEFKHITTIERFAAEHNITWVEPRR